MARDHQEAMSTWMRRSHGENHICEFSLIERVKLMNTIALVTDQPSLPIDYDMPLLLEACDQQGLSTEVLEWDDNSIDWSKYQAVLLRSPWDYMNRLSDFVDWCERVESVTQLLNPLPVIKWSLDKRYIADLASMGVPTVPTIFIDSDVDPEAAFDNAFRRFSHANEIVLKPSIGAYSKDVCRFRINQGAEGIEHIQKLFDTNSTILAQPYLRSIDTYGETDLIYFQGTFSHAIRKGALLMEDGTVHAPETNFRSNRTPDNDERIVAEKALQAARDHLGLKHPLLYARIDLVKDDCGNSVLLEMEIAEPSLSLPFDDESAARFARALSEEIKKSND